MKRVTIQTLGNRFNGTHPSRHMNIKKTYKRRSVLKIQKTSTFSSVWEAQKTFDYECSFKVERYQCLMCLYMNSRKHENIGLPFNHCFCDVCCQEILIIKY